MPLTDSTPRAADPETAGDTGAGRWGRLSLKRSAAGAGATAARAAADALVEFSARPANPPRAFPARFAEEPARDVELV